MLAFATGQYQVRDITCGLDYWAWRPVIAVHTRVTCRATALGGSRYDC